MAEGFPTQRYEDLNFPNAISAGIYNAAKRDKTMDEDSRVTKG